MKRDLLKEVWHIKRCSQKSCWCRIICTDPDSDDMETCVIPSGGIPKEYAEHVVKLHNLWLMKQ